MDRHPPAAVPLAGLAFGGTHGGAAQAARSYTDGRATFHGSLREAVTMATLRPHPIVLDAHVWAIVLIVVAFILVSGLLTVVW